MNVLVILNWSYLWLISGISVDLPNKIGYLLGMPTKKLDAVIYYEKYVSTARYLASGGESDADGLGIEWFS